MFQTPSTTDQPKRMSKLLPLLSGILVVAVLAGALVFSISSRSGTHAASTARCPGNLSWGRGGFTLLPEHDINWRTCRGTKIQLAYQADANLVLYIAGKPRWATHTNSVLLTPWKVVFQSDGNLVAYDTNAFTTPAVWSSHTNGRGTGLSLQEDGNFVIYNARGQAIWSSHTCCWS